MRELMVGRYQQYFAPLRDKPLRILEIGVGGYDDPSIGGDTLRVWKQYFPKAMVYGIDIVDKETLQEERIVTFQDPLAGVRSGLPRWPLTQARRHSSMTPQTLTAKLAPPVRLFPTRIFGRLRHAVSPVPARELAESEVLRGVRHPADSDLLELRYPALANR
jgi:hypothetical protein